MNLPPTALNIFAKWQLYATVVGIAIVYTGAVYLKGHSDGVDTTNDHWKAAIADAKPVEVHRDTTYQAQKPDSGTFTAQAILNAKYQKKVAQVIQQAQELVGTYANENDSLKAINANLTSQLQSALQPKLIHLQTAEIGDLILQYFPADSSANVYKHTPPPERVVTVYLEKPVLEPQSMWTTVGHVAIGVATGAVLGYIISHK
jgi:hypothetical protein